MKKLWTNIKQTQRDAITKERQARMATGGGPEQPEANIDPDVALIAPHLMKTAPVLFTSNMTDKEISGMYRKIIYKSLMGIQIKSQNIKAYFHHHYYFYIRFSFFSLTEHILIVIIG